MPLRYDSDDGSYTSRIKNIPDVISMKLNDEEKMILADIMEIIEQTKPSTAMKQAALTIGAKVVLDESLGKVLQVIHENKRKNKRLGYDAEFA